MRAERPELFSDSAPMSVTPLDSKYLEYILDTLTNRSQEHEFESFCRRLVEVEICPNLKPQTGPTGGGDSGVDASTYPVAPALAESVWWGTPAPPSSDSWAFAFSCKKKWAPKIASDIAKIAKLGRKFVKAFFITNQFVRDKARADTEDALTEKHGFEVHIFDRTWIVTRVIEHKREDIAFETLDIKAPVVSVRADGPRDLARKQQLDALLARLSDLVRYHDNDYAIADDYRHAALLARGLDKPRQEVEGLFTRARNIAARRRYSPQEIRCGYDHAWTTLWWYDDYNSLLRIYGELEHLLTGVENAEDCERFANLFQLLHGAMLNGELSEQDAKLDERLNALRRALERIARTAKGSSNSLYAITELHFLDLHLALVDPTKAKPALDGLKNCLDRAVGLGNYPGLKLINTIVEAGVFYGHLPGYDGLFRATCAAARRRNGEATEGRMLFDRALQLIGTGQHAMVLRLMNEARIRLFKRETMKEGLRANLACSYAYMDMGLFWAARMEAITAAHAAIQSQQAIREFPGEALSSAIQLCRLELALGRVGAFITWFRLAWSVLTQLDASGFEVDRHVEQLRVQEGVFGCLLLNLETESIAKLSCLEPRLDDLGLPMARLALLYAMNETSRLVAEWPEEVPDKQTAVTEHFALWKSQPAYKECPRHLPEREIGYVIYETTIMGVCYRVKSEDELGPILFAENLLAVIEAALALADWRNLAFIVDEVNIAIETHADGHNPPPLTPPSPPKPQELVAIWRPDMLTWLNETDRKVVTNYLMQQLLLILFTTTIDPMQDLERELDRWHHESVFNRALGMSPTSRQLTDILGDKHHDISFWCRATPSSTVQQD